MQSNRSGELAVVDVPPPALQPGGVLVRNAASLISPGTERQVVETARRSLLDKARQRPDLVRQVLDKARTEGIGPTIAAVTSRLDRSVPLGYSSAGVVVEVGEGLEEFRPGDLVACAGAGYAAHAEYVFVPRNLTVKMPEANVSFEEAAFTTVGAIALQGVRVAEARIGEVVVVVGLGLVGLLTVQLLKAAGCRVLGMDPVADRCRLAEDLGCDATFVTAAAIQTSTSRVLPTAGADAVILTAGTESNEPVELAGELCREKGRVVVLGAVGMDVPRRPFYEKELDLRLSRSYGPGRYDPEYEEKGHDYPIGYVRWTEKRNMEAFIDLLGQGKMDVQRLITHLFPIDEAAKAYDLITGKVSLSHLGVLITYPALVSPPVVPVPTRRIDLARTLSAQRPSTVSVGLLGAGNFATATLLPAMRKVTGVELTAVCTATGSSARRVGDKFGFRYCTTDETDILGDPAVNTAVIATRHNLHSRQTVAALSAGKHVFCEKPLALEGTELGDVVRAFDLQQSVVFMVGYNRRFAPMARQLKAFLTDVQEPLVMEYRINAGFIPRDSWVHDPDQGGGRVVGEVCHFVDFLTFLTGSLPVNVHTRALPNGDRYRDDNLVATVEFADGSLGTIAYVANGDQRFPKERVEVFGGQSTAVLDDFRRLELVRNGHKKVRRSRLRQDKGHQGEWEAFVACVRDGTPLPISFKETVSCTLTTFRIMDSLRTGRPTDVKAADFMASSLGDDGAAPDSGPSKGV